MISYKKKFYFFKVKETWFTYKYNFWDLFSLKVYSHIKNFDGKKIMGVKDNSSTVELSLLPDSDVILAGFRNTVRQEIRKSEKENVTCSFEQDIDRFVAFYNDFANAKKIYPTSKVMIEAMGPSFIMSWAKIDGEVLAAHSYLVDQEAGIARLYHSASRRLDQTIDRNIIGRANKLLTAKDIFYFKDKGFHTMDFGGYADNTEDKSLKGINEFKLSFGGEKVTCINYNSILYYTIKKITDFLDRRY